MGSELVWNTAFTAAFAAGAENTAPVESVVRNCSYYLRARFTPTEYHQLHVLDMGCGAGATLIWFAKRGMQVCGLDISPQALAVCRQRMREAGVSGQLVECSATQMPFASTSFDIVVEANMVQHLPHPERTACFGEVYRVLKPGGLFCGQMEGEGTTAESAALMQSSVSDDPHTVVFTGHGTGYRLEDVGLCHFFRKEELQEMLSAFATVDVQPLSYGLPQEEARRRGQESYVQSFWQVYAIK